METFQNEDGIKFHHNSDYSGNVIIVNSIGETMEIPNSDIFSYVASAIRDKHIETLTDKFEEMSDEDILTGSLMNNGGEDMSDFSDCIKNVKDMKNRARKQDAQNQRIKEMEKKGQTIPQEAKPARGRT